MINSQGLKNIDLALLLYRIKKLCTVQYFECMHFKATAITRNPYQHFLKSLLKHLECKVSIVNSYFSLAERKCCRIRPLLETFK